MEHEFGNCTDDKVSVHETLVSSKFINKELHDTDIKRSMDKNVTIKDENIDDQAVVGFFNENLPDTQYKQESIHNYISIKSENVDEFISNCTDNKVSLKETVIRGGYSKQEPCGMKDEQRNIQNYLGTKNENVDDLTVIEPETGLMTNRIDNKICVHETIITGGYIKEEPCDGRDESGSIYNNVIMKGCEECGEEYDLYCPRCPMLIRIFDDNNPDERDDTVRQTLPKNLLGICQTPSGVGIVALRAIPRRVVFGPFKGLDSTKDELISKWKLKNKELDVTKNPEGLNWMQYIRKADKSSHQNLVPFQYENGLYYLSECHINVGDELLVCWDSDSKESEIQDMTDTYWEPPVCESFDDSYACTFCCVGYKSINHLKAHNFTCLEKRNKIDFCKEIVHCDICKIYLDKKEYLDYHMDQCYKSDGKCIFSSRYKRNRGRPLHNGDRPFSCSLCPYKATRNWMLKQHLANHNSDRPFACTLCPYKAKTKWHLKEYSVSHSGDKPFACTLCPYKTKYKSYLKRHIANHNGDKPFACTLCPYKTKHKSYLKRHIANHNNDKLFACTFCPYKTTRKSNFTMHNALHNDNKAFVCTLCPYKTKYKLYVKRHIANHKNDKLFACIHCPYKTRSKSKLTMHVALHNNDKPFVCTLCPYKTKYESYLKRHIAIHNDDKPFACTHCPYTTKYKSFLKQHIAIHSGDKPFVCTLCPYKTARKSCLKRHFAIHNGDKP